MPVLPGAEPFSADRGSVGVLLCHGFTGTPQSLRPWAEHLADQGLTVRLPRLPGHGTTWREMNLTRWPDWLAELERPLDELAESCEQVFVMGLSMGATLAIRLAQTHGDKVSGLVLVNPSLLMKHPLVPLAPILSRLVPSVKGIASDIRSPDQVELAYDRVPLKAFASLAQLWAVTRRDLPLVTAPLLLFRSAQDHVVAADSSQLLVRTVSSTDVEERVLHDSFHVATLDHDAPLIFAGSVDFVRRHATAATGG